MRTRLFQTAIIIQGVCLLGVSATAIRFVAERAVFLVDVCPGRGILAPTEIAQALLILVRTLALRPEIVYGIVLLPILIPVVLRSTLERYVIISVMSSLVFFGFTLLLVGIICAQLFDIPLLLSVGEPPALPSH